MGKITEGKLTIEFPTNWQVMKYDETTFYQKHFQKLAESKAVDFVAFEDGSDDQLWLIELKDYRIHPRTKAGDLFLKKFLIESRFIIFYRSPIVRELEGKFIFCHFRHCSALQAKLH